MRNLRLINYAALHMFFVALSLVTNFNVCMDVCTWGAPEALAAVEVRDESQYEEQDYPQKITVGEIASLVPEGSYLGRESVTMSVLLVLVVLLYAFKNRKQRHVRAYVSIFLIIVFSSVTFLAPYSHIIPDVPDAEAAIAPKVRGVSAFANGAGNITVTLPAHDANDILLLFVETNANETPGTPSGGWAHVADSPQSLQSGTAAASAKLTVYWLRASSSSETNPLITDPGDHNTAFAMVISGAARTGDPWDVTSPGGTGTGTGNFSITGDTTTVANTLVVAAVAVSRDSAQTDTTFANWTNSNLANLTERADRTFGGANGGGIGAVTGEKASIGSYGNTTVDITQGASEDWAAITIALKPYVASPIDVFDLTFGVDNTSASSYNTASISPGANRLVMLTVGHADTAGGEVPTASGAGLTFTQLETRVVSNRRITLFHALSASPSSGAITISYASDNPTSVAWSIVEFSGVDTSGSNGAGAIVQSEQDGGVGQTSGSVALAAFGSADNATFMAVEIVDGVADFTPESGYQGIHFQTGTGSYSIKTAWNEENDTTPSADWGATRQWGLFGVEIKAARAADASSIKIRGGATIRGGAIFR